MKNYFVLEGDIAKVYSNGKHKDKFFLIDKVDLDLISIHSWRIAYTPTKYKRVETSVNIPGTSKNRHILLGRFLLNAPPNKYVDHENRDPMDNRRGNLRFASPLQNSHNAPKTQFKTHSIYKGVSWHKNKNKFIVSIQHNHQKYHLGYFVNEIDAAKCYDVKAKELFREFGCLNFPG